MSTSLSLTDRDFATSICSRAEQMNPTLAGTGATIRTGSYETIDLKLDLPDKVIAEIIQEGEKSDNYRQDVEAFSYFQSHGSAPPNEQKVQFALPTISPALLIGMLEQIKDQPGASDGWAKGEALLVRELGNDRAQTVIRAAKSNRTGR